ncbi:MAG: RnfABCDGE type electron transport complex subunit D [Clostridiales bacterium]|nr:RnfABCDGE type electron transport complex subunit D [Clostridiales bacterium]
MIVRQGAPYIKTERNLTYISTVRLLALFPVIVASVVFYGLRALILVAFCAAMFFILDEICTAVRHMHQPRDLSSFFNGALIALLLPPDTPLYIAFTGVLFGSVIIRQLSGGRGSEFILPAAGGRIFIRILFPVNETAFAMPAEDRFYLRSLIFGSEGFEGVDLTRFHISELIVGKYPSFIGVSCAMLIVAGLIYMIWKKTFRFYVPLAYIVALVILLIIKDSVNGTSDAFVFILTSGVLFQVAFLISDEGSFLAFGPMAMLEAVMCAALTFLMSFKTNGIDVILVPYILTAVLTGVIRYAGTIMKAYTEDKLRAES